MELFKVGRGITFFALFYFLLPCVIFITETNIYVERIFIQYDQLQVSVRVKAGADTDSKKFILTTSLNYE